MGFLFLVLYPPSSSASRPPLSLTHSHSLTLTHSHSLTLTHSHTHSLTHPPTHARTHSLTTHSLTHSPTHPLTHSTHSHSLTHLLTHSPTHPLTHSTGVGQCASLWCPLGSAAFAWQACDNVHCQGVGCTPWRPSGVPLASLWCPLGSAAFAWQAWDNVHCQGVGCTPWRPSGVPLACLWRPCGVPLVSLGLRCFCVARGRMYALASLWRPSGVPWAPLLLRGRRGTMCTAKGSDVRPGVPLASLWCPLGSAAFAWQAWDNVHCQGVGCTPWRPSGAPLVSLGLRCFCVAGVGQLGCSEARHGDLSTQLIQIHCL